MLRHIKSDYVNWFILIGLLLLLLEVLFFNGGLIITFIISIGAIYLGSKWKPKVIGKISYGVGWFWLVITILNMITFRYFLFVILIYLIVQYYQTQKKPREIKIKELLKQEESPQENAVFQRKKILDNRFFSSQETPHQAYEWNDVNIQVGIGNTEIDLSETVLPKGESVIFIRSLVGNVTIFVPYEIEIHINHSVMAGTVSIFREHDERVVNENVVYQSENYPTADEKIRLFTSMISGRLEVKRI
ncbi:cell wall-active antibiotics response protein LiaF [Metabacillus sp. HB246100]